MTWLTKRWLRKQRQVPVKEKEKRDALKIISSPPVRDYLVALMGELVREGIYLSPDRQAGARFTVELLSEEIKKGEQVFREDNAGKST